MRAVDAGQKVHFACNELFIMSKQFFLRDRSLYQNSDGCFFSKACPTLAGTNWFQFTEYCWAHGDVRWET